MTTLIWIVIAVAIVVVVAGLVGLRTTSERRLAQRREKALELRQEVEERTARADQREALSREQAEIAQNERSEAEKIGARANKLDPDYEE